MTLQQYNSDIKTYLNMNIDKNQYEIKTEAIKNKKIFKEFIDNFKIENNQTINDLIISYLYNHDNKSESYYTYWVDNSYSWFLQFYEMNKSINLSEEQKNSLDFINFKIRYIYTDRIKLKEKILHLYNFTNYIKELLQKKGINTKIIVNNFTINIDDLDNITIIPIFNYNILFKEPFFNIKLVIDNTQKNGGATRPRAYGKRKINNIYISALKNYINIEKYTNIIKTNPNFNNKILFEFNLEYYHEIINEENDKKHERKFDMESFKKYFLSNDNYEIIEILKKIKTITSNIKKINQETSFLRKNERNKLMMSLISQKKDLNQNLRDIYDYSYKNLKNEKFNKLNKLNNEGLILFTLLNTINLDDEFGINVDKYRVELFFKFLKNKDIFLINLLDKYKEIFGNFKSYNTFFIEKVQEYINKFQNPNYEKFKDYLDKWFVAKFRPSINAFIIEINEILFELFKVKIFIAGGDAMRRYKNDISFTKDIDVKLYIGNIDINDLINLITVYNYNDQQNKKYIDRIKKLQEITDDDEFEKIIIGLEKVLQNQGDIIQQKIIIKDIVVGIIVKHIVKLRNYLEQNIKSIFQSELNYKQDGTKILFFKHSNDKIFKFDLLLDEINSGKYQQFRTRENKKRIDFPVDLYSIDFRTFFGIYDKDDNLIGKKISYDISLLDVVLQDNDDFHDNYYENVENNIPVASLYFLLKDFYNTYNIPDRALARISSGKVIKDISRFNEIKYIFNHKNEIINDKYINISNIDELIIYFNRINEINSQYNGLLKILNKIKNNEEIILMDILYIKQIINFIDHNNPIFNDILKLFKEMIEFKGNIYNEDLNKIDLNYENYKIDNDIIRQKYYELFYKLCSIDNQDGLVRHVIMFSNTKIKSDFTINKIEYKSIQSKTKSKTESIRQSKAKSKTESITQSKIISKSIIKQSKINTRSQSKAKS